MGLLYREDCAKAVCARHILRNKHINTCSWISQLRNIDKEYIYSLYLKECFLMQWKSDKRWEMNSIVKQGVDLGVRDTSLGGGRRQRQVR